MSSVQEYDSWKRFDMAIKTKATGKLYRSSVLLFMEFLNVKTPDDMLSGSDEYIQDRIEQFLKTLMDKGRSKSLAKARLAGLKLFYTRNRRRTIAFDDIVRTIPNTKKKRDNAYLTEHIARVLQFAKPRERAVVLMLATTGMRIGGLLDLKIKHLIPNNQYGLYKIVVYEGWPEEYYTFCTPECRQAIDTYLESRKRAGERINDESPVFRTDFNADMPDRIAHARHIGYHTLAKNVKRLMEKAGIRKKITLIAGEEKGVIRHPIKNLHGFRKFYDTMTTTAGISPLWVETLEGHDIKLKESYFRPSEADLLEGNDRMRGYVDAIDYLTINEENRLKRELKTSEEKRESDKMFYADVMARLEKIESSRHPSGAP